MFRVFYRVFLNFSGVKLVWFQLDSSWKLYSLTIRMFTPVVLVSDWIKLWTCSEVFAAVILNFWEWNWFGFNKILRENYISLTIRFFTPWTNSRLETLIWLCFGFFIVFFWIFGVRFGLILVWFCSKLISIFFDYPLLYPSLIAGSKRLFGYVSEFFIVIFWISGVRFGLILVWFCSKLISIFFDYPLAYPSGFGKRLN